MTDKQKQAYGWALNQNYTSVAARYARVLAEYVRDMFAPLTLKELIAMDCEELDILIDKFHQLIEELQKEKNEEHGYIFEGEKYDNRRKGEI